MSFDPIQVLSDRFRAAIAAALPDHAGGAAHNADPLISASKSPKFGDFQSNAAMPLGKALGIPPREVAQKIIKHLDLAGIAEPVTDASIAGPGFINITLRADALASLLSALDTPALGIESAKSAQTIVVDLMGVNLAKQMHVGHLRSPIIGDCLARVFERFRVNVIRQNHVGDWGLPIAMVISRLSAESAAGLINLSTLTLDQLDSAYKAAQSECQRDAAGLEAVRRFNLGPKAAAELEEQVAGATEAYRRAQQTLLRLQNHDPEVVAIWKRISDVTMAVCLETCSRLNVNVTAEHSAGESSYAEELPAMVDDLLKRGVAEESDGALVIRLEEPEFGGIKEPCIIRKSERGGGGFLYATTDIAAVRRRVQKFKADRIVYAIDARQSLHIRQFAGAAKKAGYSLNPVTRQFATVEHAAFGSILGEDGRPFKTRSGESAKLSDLLDETVSRTLAAVRSRSPDLPAAEAGTIAEAVGIAAIKYADLSSDRIKDYVFSFDRMLAFEGNTGPYLLYALVRIRSIFRKAASTGIQTTSSSPFSIAAKEEKDLALAILRYPSVVRSVADALEPHRLCQYLFELAAAFSVFFDKCPVLQAPDDATRSARLRLCALTERVLADGLSLLGIPTLDRM